MFITMPIKTDVLLNISMHMYWRCMHDTLELYIPPHAWHVRHVHRHAVRVCEYTVTGHISMDRTDIWS